MLAELAPLATAGGIGLAVVLALAALRAVVSKLPTEDRSFMDPPPLLLRPVWAPIHWTAELIAPLLPARPLELLGAQMRRAGLGHRMNPQQMVALCLLLAAPTAVLAGAGTWRITSDSSYALSALLGGGLAGAMIPVLWLRERGAAMRKEISRGLPFLIDLLTLCVEAGLNIQGAFQQAMLRGPAGILRNEIQQMMRDVRAGKSRAASMADWATRLGDRAVARLVGALSHAEASGMNIGPVLRRQADSSRAERFQRAELAAFRAPVKMLLPLITMIFPCTFIVIFFPIAMQLFNGLG